MKLAVNLLWVFLSVLGALALAHVVGIVNPNEMVTGLWLVVAVVYMTDVVRSKKEQIMSRPHPRGS